MATGQLSQLYYYQIDRVPPTLADALRAKVKRDGLSIRSVTLTLWKQWIEGPP